MKAALAFLFEEDFAIGNLSIPTAASEANQNSSIYNKKHQVSPDDAIPTSCGRKSTTRIGATDLAR